MKIVILDKQVMRNLSLFKHLILRQAKKKDHFRVAKKVYKGYVNRHTGELSFADFNEKKEYPSTDWKPILIQLRPEEEGAFEVLSEEEDASFDCQRLEKQAYAIFTKTLHILNQLSYDPKHGKNPFWVLRHLAQLDFVLSEELEGERNLVHSAWHLIDRSEAEQLLKNEPPGTYLFRKDDYATLLEEALNESFAEPVTCITLTYRGWEGKISERTLVFCDGKWILFNDDPTLSGPKFENVKDLLSTMSEEISKPLLAD
jgi:hypothetical protein